MPTNGLKMTPVKRLQVPKEVVRPARAGKDWCGHPHKKLLDQAAGELTTLVGQPTEEKVWVSPGGRDMAVRFALPAGCLRCPGGGTPVVWVAHSNNRRRSLKFYLGVWFPAEQDSPESVVVTDVVDPVPKFTAGVDVPNVVHSAVTRLVEKGHEDLAVATAALSATELREADRDLVLMRAGRQGILPWSKLGKVHPDVDTAWDLAVTFGVVLATESPWHVPEQGLLFWRLLNETVGAGETARVA